MKKLKTLSDALVFHLNGVHEMETKHKDELQAISESITANELQQQVARYYRNSIKRLNKLAWAFEYLNEKPTGRANLVSEAMIEEIKQIESHSATRAFHDLLLLDTIQRICKYKISIYSSARNIALELRLQNVAEILKDLIEEEANADSQFAALITQQLNEPGFAMLAK